MKKTFDFIFRFCEAGIKYIALLPLALLFIFSTLFQNTISFDLYEKSAILTNGPTFYLVLLLTIPAFYGIYKLLTYIPEKALFIVLSILYLICGIYLITNIQMELRYDSAYCYWNALNLAEGIYANFGPGEYFYHYPHQLGLVLYNYLLVLLSDNVNLVFYFNLFWIILTNFFLWKISFLLFEEKTQLRKLIILLTFCFLPQFFYLFFAYGQVPGLAFLTGALYFGIKFLKSNKKRFFVLCFLFLAASCLVRKNYLIAGIAIIIIFLLKALKNRKWIYLPLALSLIISLTLPVKLVCNYFENVADANLDNGQPALLFVAMGLQEQTDPDIWRASGWFNAYSELTYRACNYDTEECNAAALESIHDSLYTFSCYPEQALAFFGEKIITTWCEPTFQSIWSGPVIAFGCETDSALLNDLYSNGTSFHLFTSLMNILVVLIFAFSLLYLIKMTFIKKESLNELELFSVLFFLGGFFFHLVWETKSQYVYPYMVTLIPFACCGVHYLFSLIDEVLKRFFQKKEF